MITIQLEFRLTQMEARIITYLSDTFSDNTNSGIVIAMQRMDFKPDEIVNGIQSLVEQDLITASGARKDITSVGLSLSNELLKINGY